MFKSSFSVLALTLSLNLMSFSGFAAETVESKEIIKESPVYLNQEKLDDLVKGVLKDSGKNWKILTKVERKNGATTLDYIPEDGEGESFKVFSGPSNKALFAKSEEALIDVLTKLMLGAAI